MGAGLRCLVVEGNVRAAREAHAAETGRMPCESYAEALAAVAGGLGEPILCDFAFPADAGANLPDSAGLSDYDAVVLTGSALSVYRAEPAVLRQIALMRAVYASGTPAFGSCWGLQVGTVAAGGTVAPTPTAPEIGFARRLTPTEAGRTHPLLAGRPAAYDAPAVHLDAVVLPAGDCTVLAVNDLAPVQAAEIRSAGGTFWGVQYHPEFALDELGAIVARYGPALVEAGLCRAEDEAAAYAADLAALHADPGRADLAWRHGLNREVLDPARRLTEIRNFLRHRVGPEKSRRGRA
jgi:GMP synthase (glutamine-hydrolysing)